jgi:ATP-dependent DNA helicase DinG
MSEEKATQPNAGGDERPLPEPLSPKEGQQLIAFIDGLFGPEGKLVQSGRSYRSQQHTLAKAVARSFIEAKPGMYEGAVGVGKTFAYLSCVLWIAHQTGRRTIIAVSTNSLLDQIYNDIPMLLDLTGLSVTYGQLKGRANYVCQETRDESIYKMNEDRLKLDSREEHEAAERLLRWASEGEGTDLTKYDESPSLKVVRLATITGQECKLRRSECQYAASYQCDQCGGYTNSPDECRDQGHRVHFVGPRCNFMSNRRRCADARVVVTNLNLLLLNHEMERVIFGAFEYIVLDEAHEVNSKVRDEYTDETALSVFDRAASHLRKLASNHGGVNAKRAYDTSVKMDEIAGRIRTEMFDYALRRDTASNKAKEVEALLVKGYDGEKLFRVATELRDIATECCELGREMGDKGKADEPAKTNVTQQAETVFNALTFGEENQAVGITLVNKYDREVRPKLKTVPVEVGGFVRACIHAEGVVIAVSATLTTDGRTWSLPKKQLGMPDTAIASAVGSPFNYEANAAIYIPSVMPESYKRDEYNQAAAAETHQLVRVIGGRTLVLCSARDDINVARDAIEQAGFEVLVQGEAPPRELARRFKENPASCLVGSKTFGTGFDVQGEALECVILWKLPFAKQSLVDEFIKKRDGEGAWRGGYYVPAMLLELRQWAGRLIRHKDDIGVIALMDTMKVAQLKKLVLPALPKGSRILRDVDEVEAFMLNAKMGAGITPSLCNWCGAVHIGGPEYCKA